MRSVASSPVVLVSDRPYSCEVTLTLLSVSAYLVPNVSSPKRRIETDVMKLLMSDYDVQLVNDNMQVSASCSI